MSIAIPLGFFKPHIENKSKFPLSLGFNIMRRCCRSLFLTLLLLSCGNLESTSSVENEDLRTCASRSRATCTPENECFRVQGNFYDEVKQCTKWQLLMCAGDPGGPKLRFTPTEQLVPVVDPEGNCWAFANFWPAEWKVAEFEDNCPPPTDQGHGYLPCG